MHKESRRHIWPEWKHAVHTLQYTGCINMHTVLTLMHAHKHASCCTHMRPAAHTHTLVSHHRTSVKVAGRINDVSWCKQTTCYTRCRLLRAFRADESQRLKLESKLATNFSLQTFLKTKTDSKSMDKVSSLSFPMTLTQIIHWIYQWF